MHMNTVQTPNTQTYSAGSWSKDPVLNEILEHVASDFGITVQEMLMSCRSHDVWKPRMAAMYFARLLTQTPLIDLGEVFGGRSHTTVLRAYRRCRSMIEQDDTWSFRMDRLLARLVERSILPRVA
jgi:chromosomal replication initiator protein